MLKNESPCLFVNLTTKKMTKSNRSKVRPTSYSRNVLYTRTITNYLKRIHASVHASIDEGRFSYTDANIPVSTHKILCKEFPDCNVVSVDIGTKIVWTNVNTRMYHTARVNLLKKIHACIDTAVTKGILMCYLSDIDVEAYEVIRREFPDCVCKHTSYARLLTIEWSNE